MIYADQRWVGYHGIGRFARHVLSGLEYRPISLSTNPAAPLDSWRLANSLRNAAAHDLFFSPGYNTPLFGSFQLVFTIHDLSHVFCPENSSPLIRLYYATVLKQACHRATRILAVSEFTRAQIAEWSGVACEKISNVGCGVDAHYSPNGETYGLCFPYILCVSNRKPHKNERRTIEAFARARIDPRVHLVFTGLPDPSLASWIEKHALTTRVDFLGVIPEQQFPSLYRGAEALIFASLYEGFGLPILEAMACGTPVITSDRTAMPEVAGGAAMLAAPTCIDQLSQVITQVVNDSGLRACLKERGLIRAAQYTWGRTTSAVHRLLHSN